jgi:hydroxylamine dehydrogenase
MKKRGFLTAAPVLFVAWALFLAVPTTAAAAKAKEPVIKVSKEGQACIECHESQSPSFVKDWKESRHAAKGVDCYTCHKAEPTDVDAKKHYGYTIAVLVTPKDCGKCHAREVKEFAGSHHAKAGDILNSLDNYLGEVVAGPQAVTVGCIQCHGSKVKVLENGSLDPSSWPNTGIGRINPDGSRGSCAACHTRHSFSVAQAREPEACGKCHLGPDHPQMEVYMESKHGILYEAKKNQLNMDKRSWVVGKDYTAAPTCATCHMGATIGQPATHDVGTRLSWSLRPPVSKKMENAEKKRADMKDVCGSCHSTPFVEGHYKQFDDLVDLYDTKFAEPAGAIMKDLANRGLIKTVEFDKKLDWTYFELWHHEGRRARVGAAMSGPDYAWWHGMYDVSKNFYTQFLPEVKEIAGPAVYDELVKKYLASDPRHEWFMKGMSKDQLEKIRMYYKKRYDEKVQ